MINLELQGTIGCGRGAANRKGNGAKRSDRNCVTRAKWLVYEIVHFTGAVILFQKLGLCQRVNEELHLSDGRNKASKHSVICYQRPVDQHQRCMDGLESSEFVRGEGDVPKCEAFPERSRCQQDLTQKYRRRTDLPQFGGCIGCGRATHLKAMLRLEEEHRNGYRADGTDGLHPCGQWFSSRTIEKVPGCDCRKAHHDDGAERNAEQPIQGLRMPWLVFCRSVLLIHRQIVNRSVAAEVAR